MKSPIFINLKMKACIRLRKVINLRSGKDANISVGMSRKSLEPISSQEELQVEKELQQTSYQSTGERSQATTTTKRNHSVLDEA